jgi:hypothetical protein
MVRQALAVVFAVAAPAATVEAMGETEATKPAAPRACPSCGAEQPVGTKFCTACGALVAAERPRPTGKGRRGAAPAALDQLERAKGRREFARVKTIAFSMRALFFACAFLAVVFLLLGLLARSGAPGDERWIVDLFLLLVGVELLLSIAGGLFVVRAPLVWTVVAASYYTLNTSLEWLLTDFEWNLRMALRSFGVVCMWCGVAQASRLQQLMAADPSLTLRIQKVAPERQVHGGVVDQANARRRREGRAALVRRLQLVGAIVVGLALVGFAVSWLSAPPTVDASVQRFQTAWRQSGAEAVRALFPVTSARLAEDLERRGWATSRPALGTLQLEATETHAEAKYPIGDTVVRVRWQLVEGRWQAREILLPALQPTAIEPAVQAFREAWQAAGTEALVQQFRSNSRERLGPTLVRMLTKRDWHERRPPITETYPGRDGGGRQRVGFGIDGEQVDVTFEFWHPQWYVVGVSLP